MYVDDLPLPFVSPQNHRFSGSTVDGFVPINAYSCTLGCNQGQRWLGLSAQ